MTSIPKRRDIISPHMLPIYQRTLVVSETKYTPKRHSFRTNDGLLVCEYCKYTTRKGNTLSMHIRSHHHIEAGWKNVHNCSKCDYKTPLKTKLNQHIDRHHTKKTKQCPFCFKDIKLNGVFTHIYNKHTTYDFKKKNQGLSKYKLGRLIYNNMDTMICV